MSLVVSGVVEKVSLKSLTAAVEVLKEAENEEPCVCVWLWVLEACGELLVLCRPLEGDVVWMREKVAARMGSVSSEDGLMSDWISGDVVLCDVSVLWDDVVKEVGGV
jgi:hypothetical protein